jgi:hypothetical protein
MKNGHQAPEAFSVEMIVLIIDYSAGEYSKHIVVPWN